ncbi:hypothetical protein ADL27_50570, partial [Streptomyces sp. NRRL F-6602]
PVLDWLTDKALAALRHDEAFVLAFAPDLEAAGKLDEQLPADLASPVYLVQGIYSNAVGRPTVVEWMAVVGLPTAPRVLRIDDAFLSAGNVGPKMPGRATPADRKGLQ